MKLSHRKTLLKFFKFVNGLLQVCYMQQVKDVWYQIQLKMQKKMTGETPEVRSDKRKQREEWEEREKRGKRENWKKKCKKERKDRKGEYMREK